MEVQLWNFNVSIFATTTLDFQNWEILHANGESS